MGWEWTPAGLTGSLGGRACQRPAHQVSCSSPDGGGKREGGHRNHQLEWHLVDKGIYSSEGERGAEESFIGRRGNRHKGIPHKEVLGVIRARSSLHRGWGVEQNICGDHRKRLCTQTKAIAMLWDARAPKPLTPDLIFPAPTVKRTKQS